MSKAGYFGEYGGRFVSEMLLGALKELERAYDSIGQDPSFQRALAEALRDFAGRPTPILQAKRFAEVIGLEATLVLKREDLCHTGAHKINNALGQALMAKMLGKSELIAETGAGQHGVATATVAASLGFDSCKIFMGTEDRKRQAPNVKRMELLGAEVIPVAKGQGTLKDAINEAMRYWVSHLKTTHYLFGTVAGPHPYPTIVRDFQAVIGNELKAQTKERFGRLPDVLVACVGGGSNAMGAFFPFLDEAGVALVGVEAGGRGQGMGEHAASLTRGTVGVLHGAMSYVLQTDEGQIAPVHSVSAGLDYPGVGPELSYLKSTGRARFVTASDEEALRAFRLLASTEGILPALESAHALGWLMAQARAFSKDTLIVVNLSGRGDKDLELVESFEGGRHG